MTAVKGSGVALENVVLPATSLTAWLVWRWVSDSLGLHSPGRTQSPVHHGTPTSMANQDEILGAIPGARVGAVGTMFFVVYARQFSENEGVDAIDCKKIPYAILCIITCKHMEGKQKLPSCFELLQ